VKFELEFEKVRRQLYRYMIQLVLIRTLETIIILTLKWTIKC